MEEEPRPQCVVCGDVLTNESIKPLHLKWHLTTKHAEIGEQLCLPLAKEMTHIMCGEKAAKQLNLVPLSNDTVSWRIGAMADDVKNTLIEHIKSSHYYDSHAILQPLGNLLLYNKTVTREEGVS
ncbi:SCND3 protein, partial [Amia calva]|nr:SCND3 protein [Amia calva]